MVNNNSDVVEIIQSSSFGSIHLRQASKDI